jgi:hypothetical protein
VLAFAHMARGADIEGPYRYRLWREWGPASMGSCCFVMLNPSTADAQHDDPTIRRCISFATRWGYGRLDVVNLYALRATKPIELRRHSDPIGPRGDVAIEEAVRGARLVVAAWGVHGTERRHASVADALRRMGGVSVLGLTKAGRPKHPLYVAGITRPQPWPLREEV